MDQPDAGDEGRPFQFTDKRKVGPDGHARPSGERSGGPTAPGGSDGMGAPSGTGAASGTGRTSSGRIAGEGGIPANTMPDDADRLAGLDFEPTGAAGADAELLAARAEAAGHLDALQRERASFTNYRNRTLREQEAARVRGIEDVLTALLPVLDDIDRARAAAELTGPFAAITEKLDAALAKFDIERYGAVGEEFDPNVHDAFMHRVDPDVPVPTVELIIEPGYRIGEKIARAARVGVVGPE